MARVAHCLSSAPTAASLTDVVLCLLNTQTQAVSRLEAQVQSLQQELEHERSLNTHHKDAKAHAELEVQLAVSKASQRAVQQVNAGCVCASL